MNSFVFEPSTKFLDPEQVLFATGLSSGQVVADLGTGSGFYTMAASKIVGDQGMVFAVDILESALDHVAAEARLKGMRNLKTLRSDLEQVNSCLAIPTGSADLVVFANVVHQIKNQKVLFTEAYRIIKTGGRLLVVDWNDQLSPIGPPSAERISPEQVKKFANQVVLKEAGSIAADRYHYGLIFIK